jgi:hypothetical protein
MVESEERALARRTYANKNKTKIAEYQKKYREEKRIASEAEIKQISNKLTNRKYTEKYTEKTAEYQRKYREQNKDKINENRRRNREMENERNTRRRKALYKVEKGYSMTPNMHAMEREARAKWFENYLHWEEVKKWKKIIIDGVKFDVVQATNQFLTIHEEGKRWTIRTISKVDFYLKNSELGV